VDPRTGLDVNRAPEANRYTNCAVSTPHNKTRELVTTPELVT